MRQREELEFRLRKFEASARKANDKLVSGLFQLNTYHAARVSRIVNIVLGTVDNVKLSSFPCSSLCLLCINNLIKKLRSHIS